MKKAVLFGVGILVIALIILAYHFSFPIKEDWSNLKEYIDYFANRGYDTEHPINIELYDSVVLGRRHYILIEVNQKALGEVVLIKGITGRYKVDYLTHGSGFIRKKLAENDGKKYLLLSGRNPRLEISNITYTMDEKDYNLKIPAKERFIFYIEVDENIKSIMFRNLKVYNEQGEDITERFKTD